jgi:hypothetical protein
MKQLILLVVLAAASLTSLSAQNIRTPAPSPHQVVTQDFALSTITIDYSRPGVKGRRIFGGLVPYGKEWRTGANAVTTIAFGQDVRLEGHAVKAGKYALYTIPTPGEWTIMLNKDVKNWGTEYSSGDDVLRFSVPSYHIPVSVESFTINVDSLRDTSAVIYMIWDHTYVPIHVTANIDTTIMSDIQAGMKSGKKPYFAAASYYLKTNRDLGQALRWTDAALKENPSAFRTWYLKAQIQAAMKDKAAAVATARQGLAAAKKANNGEYVGMISKFIASLQ